MTILLTHSTNSTSLLCVRPHVPSVLIFLCPCSFLPVKMPESCHATHMGRGSLVTMTIGCKLLHLGMESGHGREWLIIKHVFPLWSPYEKW